MLGEYEELRRLAEAGLEKDREIEKLKARIDDLEIDVPPSERSNTEEGEALRLYIDELQREISTLREQADMRDKEGTSLRGSTNSSRRGSLLSMMMNGGSTHGPAVPIPNLPKEIESRINELEG